MGEGFTRDALSTTSEPGMKIEAGRQKIPQPYKTARGTRSAEETFVVYGYGSSCSWSRMIGAKKGKGVE